MHIQFTSCAALLAFVTRSLDSLRSGDAPVLGAQIVRVSQITLIFATIMDRQSGGIFRFLFAGFGLRFKLTRRLDVSLWLT
jgi:hypothetical protein